MKKINFKEQVLPHLIAILFFLIITVVFYSPLFFENKILSQHDVSMGLGGGQEAKAYREATGEQALWTNAMFSGMPAYLINMGWSGNLVKYIQTAITFGMTSTAQVTFLSLISFYILLLVYGVRPYLAIVGAVAFGLSSFNIISIGAGHIWKMRAIAYMPLVLAGVHLLFKNSGKKLFGMTILALGLTLEIQANHLQITYYLLLALLIYGISALIFASKENKLPDLLKNTGLVLVAGIIAIGCNLGQLWATYEYGKYSTRGASDLEKTAESPKEGLDKDYVFRWSSGKAESLMLLIPNVYGGASSESLLADETSNTMRALRNARNPQEAQQLARYASGYWGEQPITSPIYAGAIVCFLFLLGMLILDSKTKYWMLAAITFSLMLSWGHNFAVFNDFMYDYFPMYNKFRAVTMVLVITLMLLPLLGLIALEKVLTMTWNKSLQKNLLIALGGTAGLSLIFIIIPGVFDFTKSMESQLPKWFSSAMAADRKSILRADAWRTIMFIVLALGVIYFTLKEKLSTTIGIALLFVLVTADMWNIDRRYLNNDNYQRKTRDKGFKASQADLKIKQDKALHYRVLNLAGTWNEANTSYFHSSIGGYHGAKMKRYQELIEYCLDNQKNEVINQLQSGSIDFSDITVLNMLNAKYIKFGDNAEQVVLNNSAVGNAWVSNKIVQVNSSTEEIEKVTALDDEKTTIINSHLFPISSNENVTGQVSLTSYAPNKLQYKADLGGDGLVVFSEIYYPKGWKAYIDGVEKEILRANYVMRALEVPSGSHEIVFEFEPKAYTVGNTVMYVASVLLLGMMLVTIVCSIKEKTV